MLEKIRYLDTGKGVHVEAFTDGYAYDENSRLYLLSASGREARVKAVTSALTSGLGVEIMSDPPVEVSRVYREDYRILKDRLPSGLLHELVLSDRFLNSEPGGSRLIYVPDGQDAVPVVYEAVKRTYPVPVIDDWADWLCRRLEDVDALRRFRGNRMVYELRADEDMLDEIVSEGVKRGEIEF